MKIKDNKLPNNFNKNDYNIAIFLTSEHERAYLNEFTENFPFKRQVDAVKYIADNLPNKYRKKLIKNDSFFTDLKFSGISFCVTSRVKR